MEDIQKTLARIPHEPGIYRYFNADGAVIYVGKAKDLNKRVRQYFRKNDARDEKTARLVGDIARIETTTTTSEFEALLLEARSIRQYMPKYNVISRDDKSPLYVMVTLSEELPHITTLRKNQLPLSAKSGDAVYGPFPSSHAVRSILRQIRSIVPYCTQKQRTGKPCFYTHLGLCSPCPSEISALSGPDRQELVREYRGNMYRLKRIFDGKLNDIRSGYEKNMHASAKKLDFEHAGLYKKRLLALYTLSQYRYDPENFLDNGAVDVYREQLEELRSILGRYVSGIGLLHRIECFDMSQLYGSDAVGSMVVLTDGKSDTGEYRRFRIRQSGGRTDVRLMEEVLTRRFSHTEWPLPDLLIVDGGKPQVRSAAEILDRLGLSVPFVGLAKRQEEIVILKDGRFGIVRLPISGKSIKVLQRIRDEAHRFAITYHRLLRKKEFASGLAASTGLTVASNP